MSIVLFLSGTTMGDALGSSGRSLSGIFEDRGHRFVEINLSNPYALQMLSETIVSQPVEFAFSHMGIGTELTGQTTNGQQVNFWEGNAIPFISLFGDSPAYFFDRHVLPGPSFACLYAFPEHLKFRKALPHRKGLLGLTPLHLIDNTPAREVDFRQKESGKLLFLKNGNDPQRLINTWRDALPTNIFVMLTDLSSYLVNEISTEVGCNIDAVVGTYLRDKGIDIEEHLNVRLLLVAQLDDYLRRVKSTSMAEVLKQFPIEIHGYNWEHVDFSKCRAKYVCGGDYAASRERIKEALGLIDMSPNTSLRPHDRPLRAFGLYTLCLTNQQEFFRQHFEHHPAFTFSFDKDSLESRVAEILANPKRSVQLGAAVATAFRERFDADAFGRTMLEIGDLLRAGAGRPRVKMQDFFVWPSTKGR